MSTEPRLQRLSAREPAVESPFGYDTKDVLRAEHTAINEIFDPLSLDTTDNLIMKEGAFFLGESS